MSWDDWVTGVQFIEFGLLLFYVFILLIPIEFNFAPVIYEIPFFYMFVPDPEDYYPYERLVFLFYILL